eukprot:TRINITY_DN2902_c0_g1_i1.p1 TRINITY_DN2902_c0_g1~~TRINITY_DN2902_c0_g1_i1.p1  ORF type:complete len:648 (+),score=123.88 TRINITY_DN2902_c0_g1_i1:2632-4575(+)
MLHGSICTSSVLYSAPFNRCSAAARVAYVDESVLSLWGHDTGRSRRCNKAVLVVAGYSHRNYMNVAERYRRVQFAAVQCRRDAGLVTRLNEVKALYDKRGVSPSVAGNYADERGPVGLLVADLKSVGLMWEHDLRALRTENGDVVDPLAMEPREWEHYVRVLLKKQAFAEVVKLRPEYAGIEGGVDFVATNSLRRKTGSYAVQRSLLKIVTAGVVTNDYLSHASRGSIGEECELCESGERETREHLWWHCDAYADIRAEYGLNAETAAGWPSCLRTLGVMPKDFNTGDRTLLAEKVQAMMCAINSKRLSFVDNKRTLRLRTPPWDAVAGVPGTRHESPFRGKLPAGGLWVWDASHFLALNDWLSMLEWTDEGQISSVELAIDYEAFSGLRIEKTVGFRRRTVGTTGPLTLKERSGELYFMLERMRMMRERFGNETPLIPAEMGQVTCLARVGGPLQLYGYRRRPRFVSMGTTAVVEKILQKGVSELLAGTTWGTGLYPEYPETDHSEQHWADLVERLEGREDEGAVQDPVYCPPGVLTFTGTHWTGSTTCRRHRKPKCDRCGNAPKKAAITLDACCRAHHHEADGLPVRVCEAHSMTVCGKCSSLVRCCKKHHVCKRHAERTCSICKEGTELADRLPSACCAKGHHG